MVNIATSITMNSGLRKWKKLPPRLVYKNFIKYSQQRRKDGQPNII